jgi:uncharacterized protein (TIGR01244 family)
MLDDIYNYLPLTENLATSGQPTAPQMAEIAAAGYQLVINLAHSSTDNSLKDEAGLVRSLGMDYVHIPVIWTQPLPENLLDFFQVMDANRDRKIFAHCAANMRVSAFVALYRVLRLGWDYETALQDVLEIWLPNETWQGFIDSVLNILS